MIQITFNFKDIAAAAALFAKLNGNEIGAIAGANSVDAPRPVTVVPPLPQIVSPSSTGEFPERGMDPAVTAAEKTAVLLANEAALADTEPRAVRGTSAAAAAADHIPGVKSRDSEAPGKPAGKDASTASTATTAAASPKNSAQASSTTPPADAPSASQPGLTYADLQKVVLQLHSIDPTAPVPIAKAMGFDSFKPLKEPANAGKIPAAHAAVLAKIAELKGA